MCDENVQHGVPLRCLELFSGVGGFHYALKESVAHFEVLLAFDINDVVNAVYAHNFPGTTIRQCNIQSLKADFYDNQNADLWTMSPPCQPFTKKGAQRDVADRRCDALKSICSALQRMRRPPRFICVENVCGFETSSAHAMLVEVLTELEYELQEFILSPADLAIPNSRPRYYLLAKRNPGSSLVGMSGFISRKLPDCATSTNHLPHYIGEFVCDECDRDTRLRLDERMAARYAKGIDMVTRKSTRSSCFTKSYSLLISSSGPVLVCAPEYQVSCFIHCFYLFVHYILTHLSLLPLKGVCSEQMLAHLKKKEHFDGRKLRRIFVMPFRTFLVFGFGMNIIRVTHRWSLAKNFSGFHI
ncbi:tRNA (cytosine-5-)-methyltransferase [Toxocara canis]|uniref:tRNA (Cytosine-5-)-methyltransferase n=1 Tax=Toxocara canis TaxID=6265 RepID=A0A0B2VH12_TOXCA|nr:tRNA (cytosine-5-)-methyltransferase [Toxocara canis]